MSNKKKETDGLQKLVDEFVIKTRLDVDRQTINNLNRINSPKQLEGMLALEIDKLGKTRSVFAGSRDYKEKS